MEVKREILRVEAAEDISLARVLDARRESLSVSAPVLSGDAMCKALVDELHELSLRVSDERECQQTGRACFLAGVSLHEQQFGCAGSASAVFATPAMWRMEEFSEVLSERQQQQAAPAPALPENGRKAVPRSRLEARLAAAAPRISILRKYRRLVPFKR